MEVRQSIGKEEYKRLGTKELRENFLIENFFKRGEISLTYSHIDRIIVGGVTATQAGVEMASGEELHGQFFLERREMGVINLGGSGSILADGVSYPMNKYDCLYLGMGTRSVKFFADDDGSPALYYINSCPAHKRYDTTLCSKEQAVKVSLGSKSECNQRTINKYILPENVKSCQLVMGMTLLEDGSVWNTMPTHTHERRMEVYLYFNIKKDNVVFHLMGEPGATRHIAVGNMQAVISPSYSIHSGVGTSNYGFVWGMCGENQQFDDMDAVATEDIK